MAITVQGKTVAIDSSSLATIDIGETFITGPEKDVAAIWATVPGSSPLGSKSGFYQFPCATEVNITVSFAGKVWPISPLDLNLGGVLGDSAMCVGTIRHLSSGSTWVFGTAFLKNVYSIFRHTPVSIGFAQLSALATAEPSSSISVVASSTSSPPPTSPAQTGGPGKKNIGAISGGVVGGLALILTGIGVMLCIRRRRARRGEGVQNINAIAAFPIPLVSEASGTANSTANDSSRMRRNFWTKGRLDRLHIDEDAPNLFTKTDAIRLERIGRRDSDQSSHRVLTSPPDVGANDPPPPQQPPVNIEGATPNGGADATDPRILNELLILRAEVERLEVENARLDVPPPSYRHAADEHTD